MKNQSSTSNQENDVKRYDDELMKNLFSNYLESGGMPKVTAFKRHVDELIGSFVKPLCKSSGKSAGAAGSSWRDAQKANFAGRGAKWVKISTDDITLTLERFEANGIDCADYRAWTTQAGYAWIRYAGPRVQNDVGQAAFEVRTGGSKIDHPKQLHYMYDNNLMAHVEALGGTPHSLGLEVATPPVVLDDEVPSDELVSDEEILDIEDDVLIDDDGFVEILEDDVEEDEEVIEAAPVAETPVVNQAPTSDDPAEWEAFLEAEGLGQFEEDDEEDLFGEV